MKPRCVLIMRNYELGKDLYKSKLYVYAPAKMVMQMPIFFTRLVLQINPYLMARRTQLKSVNTTQNISSDYTVLNTNACWEN